MLAEIKDAVTPAVAGYTVNGATLTVGAAIEQYIMVGVAVLGLIGTVTFQALRYRLDRQRLQMAQEDHEAHMREQHGSED